MGGCQFAYVNQKMDEWIDGMDSGWINGWIWLIAVWVSGLVDGRLH